MPQNKRASLFVDIANQFYSVQHSHHGTMIDYELYLKKATEGYDLYRAFAYGVQMGNEASNFINVLRNLGYEPRYRQAVQVFDRPDIRRTDRNMLLAMDVWRCVERIDAVIIGSNDPDLVPLVARVKELGVQAVIYSSNISAELREAADRAIEIDLTLMSRKKEQVS